MSKTGWALGALLLASSIAACSGAGSAATNPTAAPPPAAAANSSGAPASGTPGARFARGPGAAGTVESISGSTITLKGLQNNASTTVQLSDTTTIRKQVTKAIADLQPGVQIFALGQESGNTLTARQIQILAAGEAAPTGGAGRVGGTPRNGGNGANGGGGANGGSGATGSNGGGNRAPGAFVNGTIDSVSGSTITVKKSDGSTASVTLASGGRIVALSTGTASDIKPGEFLTATGQQQGDALVATTVNLSDQAPQFGNQTAQ